PGDESTFDTTTVGAQYHFNKKTRMNVEYSMRDAKSDTTAIDNNVKGINDRFAIQVTHVF
ncbi:MAG: phosphate-selective porin O and P, partial [Gammaproteobacteria bacterium]|nr:phosphate-selective porin O and P [Gammaproteobacteria bacterium]